MTFSMRGLGLVPVLALMASCSDLSFEDYYPADGAAPQISSISPESESGNAGGQTVTITGSGFGDTQQLLLIANHNVEIVSWSDTEIVAVAPRGPITGGKVSVLVANDAGFDAFGDSDDEQGYTYDLGLLTDVGVYDGESGYVLVQNYWNSCYGGRSPDSIPNVGCEQVAYIGESGLDGQAEFYRFAYPRVHTANLGFVTGTDAAPEWTLVGGAGFPFPSGIQDLRERVGAFTLVNDVWAGDTQCVINGANGPEVDPSCGSGSAAYDLGRMQFCEGEDPDVGANYTYRADYPALHDFFQSEAAMTGSTVHFEASDSRLDGVELVIPPPMKVVGTAGVEDNMWLVTGNLAACPDTSGDGEAALDEAGVVLNWEPIPADAELGGQCVGGGCVVTSSSYVQVSLSRLNMGWFGGEGAGLRASVIVSDEAGALEIPNSILYSFPSPNTAWSSSSTITQTGRLGTIDSDASYLVMEFMRVTDYRIQNTETGKVTVFSYVTGDLTFPAWKNPLEAADDCHDCLDGDGDGWVDAADPDCDTAAGGDGLTEGFVTTAYTCNDGIDNDGDGLTDADDVEQCSKGTDGETNCGDGIDNDGDGWIDGADGECAGGDAFASEGGLDDPSWLCSDGLDNDDDGWIDSKDPGCLDGAGTSEAGLSGSECNDGLDNDGNGDIDAADPYCNQIGGGSNSEEPTRISQCNDAGLVDNDNDGFVNANDPDCEYAPHTRETVKFQDPTDASKPWYGFVAQCYDGLDNDGDGTTDAADPSCWNPIDLHGYGTFLADGFLNDEGASFGTGCTDGADDDGDGWTDGRDPDCVRGDANKQVETGFGTTQCNDGIDNNGDGKIDSASSYCASALGNFEGP